ncbi:hypothetical protein G6045_09400 [Streptomyces sp. YC504]|uniref:Uncharacterized protein n=1 Tax=Streptomyces mesophilus TaxID=1775132 RepID=A0A6G4XE98_9ACTN|nr:Imm50 family immunity protein [Streptomyces mesophilus]NGO75886.1 hypothetical protein [Streptomyces mesophilus]
MSEYGGTAGDPPRSRLSDYAEPLEAVHEPVRSETQSSEPPVKPDESAEVKGHRREFAAMLGEFRRSAPGRGGAGRRGAVRRNTTTVASELRFENSGALEALYGRIPPLHNVRLRSIQLNWRGPALTLRMDLPEHPAGAPTVWVERGMDTVQCHVQFLAVEDLSLKDWPTAALADISTTDLGFENRMAVTVSNPEVILSFTCNKSVLIGHVSAFRSREDGSDDGPHLFLSRIDRFRHDSVPPPHEKTFYERV